MSDDRWKRGVPPKVLVIGRSMAGLFAALLLRREGWDVDVYERIGAELAGRGAGIVTHSELFDVLARAGIDTAAAAVGVVVPGRRVLDRSGRIAGELALRQVLTSWGHLYGLLKAALPAQHYHHGKNLEGVTEFGDRALALPPRLLRRDCRLRREPAAKEMVTIRWRTRPDNKAEQDVYQTISDEVSKKLEAQGIQLQYDPAPAQGYLDKLTAEYSTGSAPDIAWVDGANAADIASMGAVLDLKTVADADASFKLADYYDAPMRELEQGGKLWGLPSGISTLVMYYNKDLFKAKGLEDPADLAAKGQWNWDAFRKAAIALTDPSAKQYGFAMSNEWGPWGWFVMSAGGNLYNADRTACNLTDPGSIRGLQFMADLFLKDQVGPLPGPYSETDFHAGSVAMFPNGRRMMPRMRQDKFDWGVVEMPEGPVGKKTWLFWGPYLISATTRYPEQAWQVLTELTSPEVQARLAALGASLPSNKTALDAFLNSGPPAENTPFVAGLNYAQAETQETCGGTSARDSNLPPSRPGCDRARRPANSR